MLPERLTVSTCIACGAMGRAARCAGDCSEHRLRLVGADDFDALCVAARAARDCTAVARSLADTPPSERRCAEAHRALRVAAQAALDRAEAPYEGHDWATPVIRTGWWCAECGNVDAPQPCIDVCIWQPIEWVNEALYTAEYGRGADDLRVAPALGGLLRRIVAVTPHEGRCLDAWRAFRSQAERALDDAAG